MIEIRDIIESDSDAFAALITQLAAETPHSLLTAAEARRSADSQLERTRELITSPNQTVLLAHEDRQLLGFIALTQGTLKKTAHVCSLAIGVLSAYHQRGIGSRLMQQGLAWAKSRNILRVELTVMTDNTAAIGLYQKYGFSVEGTRKASIKLPEHYADELIMAKIQN